MEGVEPASLKPMASTTPGYKHILAGGPEPVEGDWTGVWSREAAEADPNGETTDEKRGGPASRVRATVLAAPGMKVLLANVPGKRQQAILRRAGKGATFVCLVDPYRAGDAVRSIRPLKTRGPIGATGVEVRRTDGGTDLIVIRHDPMPDGEAGQATSFADKTTRALVTVCRLDKKGKPISRTELGGAR